MNPSGIRIHNEDEVTPEFVLNEAKVLWEKCKAEFKKRGLKFGDSDGAEKLMGDMRREHRKFCTAYPIVFRYMAEMQQFHPEAFRKYLAKLASKMWKNEEEYLDSQTDYVVLLYKESHHKYNSSQVRELRRNVRQILQREHDVFKRYSEEFKKEVEFEDSRLKKERREKLIDYINKLKQQDPASLPSDIAELLAAIPETSLPPPVVDNIAEDDHIGDGPNL